MRVKRGVTASARHKKIIKANKGYRGPSKNVFKRAMEAWLKAGQHAYRGRKEKKRTFRSLWIVRLNNALGELGIKYSHFIRDLNKAEVGLNRKVLSELAVNNTEVFKKVVESIVK